MDKILERSIAAFMLVLIVSMSFAPAVNATQTQNCYNNCHDNNQNTQQCSYECHSENQQTCGCAEDCNSNITITRLTGAEKNKAIADALKDTRVAKIKKSLAKEGYNPTVNNAHAIVSEQGGETWRTALIPFDDGDQSQEEQTYIVWSNNPDYEVQVQGLHVVHINSSEEPYWSGTLYKVEDNNIVTKEFRLKNFLGCDDVDWGCVLVLAGSYSTTIIACGTCVATEGWLVPACAECIGTILLSGGATLNCDWCND